MPIFAFAPFKKKNLLTILPKYQMEKSDKILDVETSDENATGMSTKANVSKKASRVGNKYGYRISNNFR